MRIAGLTRKGLRLAAALAPWGWGREYRRGGKGGVTGAHPVEHEA